jgi:outer membrane protein assembly factor BamA
LDSVRGFQYNQFAGDSYWLFNAEYRIASIDNPYVVLQHTAFVDAGGIGSLPQEARAPGLSSNDFWGVKAASTGVGVRLIVPKIRTFIVRFDYALPLKGSAVRPTSFGAGQFF